MILDLSAVTDSLIDLVKDNWSSAPIWAELGLGGPAFTPTFSGLAPDAIRDGGGSQLSLFLYHVESDNAQESSFWTSQMVRSPGQPVRYLPLALDLYYLLSAFSDASYAEEQQAILAVAKLDGDLAFGPSNLEKPALEFQFRGDALSDADLKKLWPVLEAVPRGVGLNLNQRKNLTDAGVAHLKGMKNLKALSIGGTEECPPVPCVVSLKLL